MNRSTIFLFLPAALLVMGGVPVSAGPAGFDTSETDAINGVVTKFDQAVNARDARALGALFAEDGEFTNPVGTSLKGRLEIERFHAALFSEANRPSFAHAHLTVLGATIRFVRKDVATVDVRWEQTGAIAPDGKLWGTRKGILSWVVTRTNGLWRIEVWHNVELPASPSLWQ
jgi:uncharacterized protein (TIGR02246 family)